MSEKVQEVLRNAFPKIQQLFQEKIKPGALAAAQNDEMFRPACKLIYSTLPFPIRIFVSEDTFVQFCFQHRDKLTVDNTTPCAA